MRHGLVENHLLKPFICQLREITGIALRYCDIVTGSDIPSNVIIYQAEMKDTMYKWKTVLRALQIYIV